MQVIVKTTEACNGTCIYCSAKSRLKGSQLSAEALPELFESFRPWLKQDPRRTLGFIWHGGEPLLRGTDFFYSVSETQQKVFGKDLPRIKNNIQTNLTLLTKEWFPCFHKLRLKGIGSSFDIVEGIRNIAGGQNLTQKWVEAIQLLKTTPFKIGLIYVAHKGSLAQAQNIFYFFRNIDPAMSIRVNPLYPEGRAKTEKAKPLHMTAEEYGEFLVTLFELWLKEPKRNTILPLVEWLSVWQGKSRHLCCDSLGKCHETHLGLTPDGTVYNCGRAADRKFEPLGCIFSDDLTDILERRKNCSIALRTQYLFANDCKDCRYWDLCHGGCPMMSVLYYNDVRHKDYFCQARQLVYHRFEKILGPPRFLRKKPIHRELL